MPRERSWVMLVYGFIGLALVALGLLAFMYTDRSSVAWLLTVSGIAVIFLSMFTAQVQALMKP